MDYGVGTWQSIPFTLDLFMTQVWLERRRTDERTGSEEGVRNDHLSFRTLRDMSIQSKSSQFSIREEELG
jgi:hypothetical protein